MISYLSYMRIVFADPSHIDILLPLFEGYRTFYKQQPNPEASKAFLLERMQQQEATVLLALSNQGAALGFTQLFPIFSSVSLEPMYLLNDLFVAPEARKQGVGAALLNAAKELCKKQQRKGLLLQTASDNPAQKLYERLGWIKEEDLFYFWKA